MTSISDQANQRVFEWNPWLLAVLVLAFVLRVWGIDFGLPHDFTPDEVHEIVRALKLGAGEYYWGSGKGGLYLILFVEYGFLFVFLWMTGRVSGPDDFAIYYLQDPTAFYLFGRLTVAAMGVATCFVVYCIARRAFDDRTALLASLFGATAFFHTFWSHYINVDIGMALAFWASVLCYMRFEAEDRPLWLVLAGVFAGIGIAFKVPGIAVVVPIGLAMLTAPKAWSKFQRTLRRGLTFAISLVLTVACISPETILGIASILGHFSGVINSAAAASPNTLSDPATTDEQLWDLLALRGPGYFRAFANEKNLALTAAAVIGATVSIWKRDRWGLVWLGSIMFFLVIMSLSDRAGNERYLTPIMPALWLLAARGVSHVAQKQIAVGVIATAIVAAPLFFIVHQNHMWTRPDTRVITKEWIEANLPSGSKILIDGMEHRFIQSPPLRPNSETVARRVGRISDDGGRESRGISGGTLELYAKAMQGAPDPKYDLHSTVWGLEVKELDFYPAACFEYAVLSTDTWHRYLEERESALHPQSAAFYSQVPDHPSYRLIYSAEPVNWSIQGPGITVYEILSDC